MPKTKLDGADDPTINNLYKIDKKTITNILFKMQIVRSRRPHDKYHRGLVVHPLWESN